MRKEIVKPKGAQAPPYPFSLGVKAGGFVFVSGQVSKDLGTLKYIFGDIKTEVRQILGNIKVILEASGTSMENVAKVTVFLRNMDDFDSFNEIYSEYFDKNLPARSCIQAGKLVNNRSVEIEAIAVIPES